MNCFHYSLITPSSTQAKLQQSGPFKLKMKYSRDSVGDRNVPEPSREVSSDEDESRSLDESNNSPKSVLCNNLDESTIPRFSLLTPVRSESHEKPVKSRFRGVFKCGKKWKAQIQLAGQRYYLGTFNTEVEAAHAFDRKAREESSGHSVLTNFDECGKETAFCLSKQQKLLTKRNNQNTSPPTSTTGSALIISPRSEDDKSKCDEYHTSDSTVFSHPNKRACIRPATSTASTQLTDSELTSFSFLKTEYDDDVCTEERRQPSPSEELTISHHNFVIRQMWNKSYIIGSKINKAQDAQDKLRQSLEESFSVSKEAILADLDREIGALILTKILMDEQIRQLMNRLDDDDDTHYRGKCR